ncbi:tripeptidyl-peptidase 2 [Caerostris extrusa]|uniref:Tripeptidyl-peptidase 2 n=1 Tax=Caerostris extrusa TaxID=172846 RepID=A0AAV4QZC0_CAEEX|nr:tripeptidyl-peptidase 2 [Caerostris extrusa]
MADKVNNDFPIWALLPKRETNVSSFLNMYPEYDGRGVTIAILDSGIDPGAKGLQKTNDYKYHLTGKTLLKISYWSKNAYELYPKVTERTGYCNRKTRQVLEFNNLHSNSNQLSPQVKLDKEELDAQLDALNTLEKKYNDCGPTYDCVVFHDGNKWRVVIDTSEKGDLESCKLLGVYSETYDYAMLTPVDRLNYCVNVYEEGDLLEIVSMSTGHGTHVASIAAAYFPDEPEKKMALLLELKLSALVLAC